MNRQRHYNLAQKDKGFTLIELVVTIGIISVLVAMGVPAFYAYSRQNAPRIAAQDIKNFLLEAQSLAKAPAAGDSGTDYYYVTVYKNPNSDGDQLVLGRGYLNEKDGSVRRTPTYIIKAVSLDAEARIEKLDPEDPQALESASYYFLVPQGRMLFNGLEPAPGLGYAKICQPVNPNCHYQAPYTQSVIQLVSAAGLGVSDLSVIIDGQGGNINVVEGLINL